MEEYNSLWNSYFEVLEHVRSNAYKVDLPPYISKFLIVKVKDLKLCEKTMLDEEEEGSVLLVIQDLVHVADWNWQKM